MVSPAGSMSPRNSKSLPISTSPKSHAIEDSLGSVDDPRNIVLDSIMIGATAVMGVLATDLHWIIALKGCLIGSAHTFIIPACVAFVLPDQRFSVRIFSGICFVIGCFCMIFGLAGIFGLLDKFARAERYSRKALAVVSHVTWGQGYNRSSSLIKTET
eukprot:gnl/MRDRNA2_/MRDRNA2_50152_c0_seq2.p1 gnl/MRDRNA2_/MRDRNA2_50152_c0~~gnl/MRDRNA2_/MRDRNA2_50152_c0_seq2.p1  ORF type:complete len:158 (+),score=16.33 gnl/MRDRNA2_/MRDRNA2_50152_c0_seq2:72-545(+)